MSEVLSASLLVRILLLLLLAAAVYFLSGFVVPVLAALIMVFATWPLYSRLVKRLRGNTMLAASIGLVTVLVVLIVPLSIALTYAITEAGNFIRWLLLANREGMPAPAWLEAIPSVGPTLVGYWDEYVGDPHAIGGWIEAISGQHLGEMYRVVLTATGDLFHLSLSVLFMLITLFFLYKDGHRLAAQLDLIGDEILGLRWHRFSRVVPATISSTVIGMGLIAIGEGCVLGVAYWIAGVPNPVFLGVVTGVMALIPGGAPLSFTLVSLYLIGSEQVVAGVALFLWGSIELFIVDKTLRPRLVGGPVKLPFLPTFFGLVGGVQTMGLVGLFVGPVLMALLVAIWREWIDHLQQEKESVAVNRPQANPLFPEPHLRDVESDHMRRPAQDRG